MEEEKQKKEVRTFNGSHNSYLVIAKRGQESLGLSLIYGVSPNGTGCLLTRFVVRSVGKLGSLAHMHVRDKGNFTDSDGDFVGYRLNRVAIPVFHPGPPPFMFLGFCDKFQIFEIVADWVKERCKEDGFEVIDPDFLKQNLQDMVSGKIEAPDENVQLVLTFPEFNKSKKSNDVNEEDEE